MKIGHILLGFYIVLFIVCAVSPYDRSVWVAENVPIVLLVALVVVVARYQPFSRTAYICMFVLPVLHTIGGHYTFERVPFDLVTNAFGFERNHYDRLAHFSVGLYAYAIAEFLVSRGLVAGRRMASVFAVCAIFTVASAYEIFEWIYAITAESSAGNAVLGSQGDIWDAQKDMLADGLGALFAATCFVLSRNKHAGKTVPETALAEGK